MAMFGANFIVVPCQWADVKTRSAACGSPIKWDIDGERYDVFCVDQSVVYLTSLFSGELPSGVSYDGTVTQEANDTSFLDFNTNYKNQDASPLTRPTEVFSASAPLLPYADFKTFFSALGGLPTLYYITRPSSYLVWMSINNQNVYLDHEIQTGTTECTDFETTLKPKGNIAECYRIRLTTCKIGRALHDRYISFTTSHQNNYDNTDYKDVDFGDVTYYMKRKDAPGVWTTTTDYLECDETWIDWEPLYTYEIMGGHLDVPDELIGDPNLWECHIVAVPDVPAAYGGCITLIANPRLKWKRNKTVDVDANLNPKEMRYDATYHTGKIRTIIKHPRSARIEFQLNLKLFK
jgi:hypothetical protein